MVRSFASEEGMWSLVVRIRNMLILERNGKKSTAPFIVEVSLVPVDPRQRRN